MESKQQNEAVNRNCTTCKYYTVDSHFRGVCSMYPSAGHVDAKTVCPQWQQVEK